MTEEVILCQEKAYISPEELATPGQSAASRQRIKGFCKIAELIAHKKGRHGQS
jgi:hypothetical protein